MGVWVKSLAGVIIVGMLSGCAASRSVVTLDEPGVATAENPEHGTAVKIDQVIDARLFEAEPKKPSTPSLSSSDIDDPALKARAIGRKRGGFGMALGDIMLPEDQTVSILIKKALADGFRKADYRVLTPEDSGYGNATPIKGRILKFWSWLHVGFWGFVIHNDAEVEVTGPLPALKRKLIVYGGTEESMEAVFESDWQEVSSKGLDNFSQNLVRALQGTPQVVGEQADK